MIASLRGRLLSQDADAVVVDVGGVGYRVVVTPSTALAIGDLGAEVFVHVHHHIREDAQVLYGFSSAEERRTFEALISAHGVGPSMGLAILSVHDPASLQGILATDDLAALCLVPGVGKKTATRLLVELKSKLDLGEIDLSRIDGIAGAPVARSDIDDVRQALAGLGYGGDEIGRAVADLPSDGDVSVLLKQALQRLAVRS